MKALVILLFLSIGLVSCDENLSQKIHSLSEQLKTPQTTAVDSVMRVGVVQRVKETEHANWFLKLVYLDNGTVLDGAVSIREGGRVFEQIKDFYFLNVGDTVWYQAPKVIRVKFRE